jgi:Flp pilus assembly protein TadB
MKMSMKKQIEQGCEALVANARLFKRNWLYFVPSIASIFVAMGIVLFPEAAVALGALFFVMIGLVSIKLILKVLAVKAKIENMAHDFPGSVVVHSINMHEGFGFDDDFDDEDGGKKIVYH